MKSNSNRASNKNKNVTYLGDSIDNGNNSSAKFGGKTHLSEYTNTVQENPSLNRQSDAVKRSNSGSIKKPYLMAPNEMFTLGSRPGGWKNQYSNFIQEINSMKEELNQLNSENEDLVNLINH